MDIIVFLLSFQVKMFEHQCKPAAVLSLVHTSVSRQRRGYSSAPTLSLSIQKLPTGEFTKLVHPLRSLEPFIT